MHKQWDDPILVAWWLVHIYGCLQYPMVMWLQILTFFAAFRLLLSVSGNKHPLGEIDSFNDYGIHLTTTTKSWSHHMMPWRTIAMTFNHNFSSFIVILWGMYAVRPTQSSYFSWNRTWEENHSKDVEGSPLEEYNRLQSCWILSSCCPSWSRVWT